MYATVGNPSRLCWAVFMLMVEWRIMSLAAIFQAHHTVKNIRTSTDILWRVFDGPA